MNFHKIHIFLSALILGLLGTGCSNDPFGDFDNGTEGGLRVDYLVDGEVKETRSVQAVQDEIKLNSALIFFYDLNTGKAINYVYTIPTPGMRTISFDPPSGLSPDTEYNTLVLGNPDEYTGGESADEFARSIMDLTYDAARVEIMYRRAQAITRGNPGVLPMFGRFVDTSNKSPKTFRYSENGELITADGLFFFSRALSRIDLENYVPNTLIVESVKVINYQSTGYPLTEGMHGSDIIDYAHSGSGGWMNVEALEGGEDNQKLTSALYCFPNIVSASMPDDNVTTALLIKGRYCEAKDGGTYDTESTYYRFNLQNTGKGQVLSRNYAYRAVIKGVKRRGSKTPDEAIKEHTPIFDYAVTDEWQATDDNAASDDKGNYLIVSKAFVTFDGDNDRGSAVMLNVRTNNDLVWTVEPDDSDESIDNSYFICEKADDTTLRVAPTEANNTAYVRFGRYVVTATSPSDSSVELKLTINIQHLTTSDSYAMLTVDGCTGSISKRLNPNGGVLRLRVQTGSSTNSWFAEDEQNAIKNWGTGSHFQNVGVDGADLEIVYDPNVTGVTRSTVLKVHLDPRLNPDNAVKPVFVTLTQDITADLFTLSPAPVDGAYTIDACSFANIPTTTPHTGNINGSQFTVTVTPAAGVSVTVSSNFQARDISYSGNGWAVAPGQFYSNTIETNPDKYGGRETIISPKTYYMSVPAMAPADPMITSYKMRIVATDQISGNTQEQIITFRLKAIDGDINDCIIKNGAKWFVMTDRNVDAPGRISITGEKQAAMFYRNITFAACFIPEFQGSKPVNTYTQYGGNGNLNRNNNASGLIQSWIRDVNYDEDMVYSPFYKKADYSLWRIAEQDELTKVAGRLIVSKARCFILSDYPRITPDGKKIPVIRWMNIDPSRVYLCRTSAMTLSESGWTWSPNPTVGTAFGVRELTKDQVRDYLLNYLGYTETTLPVELK